MSCVYYINFKSIISRLSQNHTEEWEKVSNANHGIWKEFFLGKMENAQEFLSEKRYLELGDQRLNQLVTRLKATQIASIIIVVTLVVAMVSLNK